LFRWREIDYSKLTAMCLKKNRKSFETHDPLRFKNYLEGVKSGKQKIASKALKPREIVKMLTSSKHLNYDDPVAVAQWTAHVEELMPKTKVPSRKLLAVLDTSLQGEALEAAVALSLLTVSVSQTPYDR
jgi:hypothetical protein